MAGLDHNMSVSGFLFQNGYQMKKDLLMRT